MDRHADVRSWAIPIRTTFPSPPSAAAASLRGRASALLALTFLEVHHRDLVVCRQAVDVF
jgi:hypothetical protein